MPLLRPPRFRRKKLYEASDAVVLSSGCLQFTATLGEAKSRGLHLMKGKTMNAALVLTCVLAVSAVFNAHGQTILACKQEKIIQRQSTVSGDKPDGPCSEYSCGPIVFKISTDQLKQSGSHYFVEQEQDEGDGKYSISINIDRTSGAFRYLRRKTFNSGGGYSYTTIGVCEQSTEKLKF